MPSATSINPAYSSFSPELQSELIEVLQCIYVDAQMALSGDWNAGDDGFNSQMQLIEQVFTKCNIQPKEYIREKEEE